MTEPWRGATRTRSSTWGAVKVKQLPKGQNVTHFLSGLAKESVQTSPYDSLATKMVFPSSVLVAVDPPAKNEQFLGGLVENTT